MIQSIIILLLLAIKSAKAESAMYFRFTEILFTFAVIPNANKTDAHVNNYFKCKTYTYTARLRQFFQFNFHLFTEQLCLLPCSPRLRLTLFVVFTMNVNIIY